MKISALRKVCISTSKFVIFDTPDGEQWLSNGYVAYPIFGLRMTRDSIGPLFDLSEKQVTDFTIETIDTEDERFCVEPIKGEEELKPTTMRIGNRSVCYRILTSQKDTYLIDEAWMEPARNKTEVYKYALRRGTGNTPLVAVYSDMLVAAIITPLGLGTALSIWSGLGAAIADFERRRTLEGGQ